jgi:hypothetical protein
MNLASELVKGYKAAVKDGLSEDMLIYQRSTLSDKDVANIMAAVRSVIRFDH